MSTTIRKISSLRRKSSGERVPVLPIHDKYAERHHELIEDPFDDIIGKFKRCTFLLTEEWRFLLWYRCRDWDLCCSVGSRSGWLFYSHSSCQCTWLWQVSNHSQLCHWSLLDGRFHGDYDSQHLVTSITLRMGSESVQAGFFDHHRLHWHDVQFSLLGTSLRQIRKVGGKFLIYFLSEDTLSLLFSHAQ